MSTKAHHATAQTVHHKTTDHQRFWFALFFAKKQNVGRWTKTQTVQALVEKC